MTEVKILIEGFTNADMAKDGEEERTSPTITFVRDNGKNIICDPGVVSDQNIILEKLRDEGLSRDDIDIVFLTHSHLDHYRNAGMFAKAKVLEYYGFWNGNKADDWDEDFSDAIKIIKTPGHSQESLTMLVKTAEGVVAICGDVFWKDNYPDIDPYASDLEALKTSRKKVLESADFVVPGHGGIFKVRK